jgi:Zn-dependent protease with chaperone function
VNEIDVATAALEPEACECGACERALFLDGDEPLKGLPATEYQHPLDANSLRALKSVPGFDRGLKWLMEQVLDRSSRLQLMSSALRCGKDQFPKLRALADVASSRLGIDFPVTLYLVQQPVLNALTTGVEERAVVVHSAMLDQMTDDELVAIMGHELGHLHAEHQLYKTMASIIVMGGTAFFMPLRLLSIPLQLALAKWARCSELTSDRAGLLATRDLGASVRVLLKLIAGDSPGVAKRGPASIAALVKQARELEKMEGSSVLDGLMAALLTLRQTHPYPAWRLMHLLQWVESGSYLDIISGKYQRAPEKPEKKEPPKKTAA